MTLSDVAGNAPGTSPGLDFPWAGCWTSHQLEGWDQYSHYIPVQCQAGLVIPGSCSLCPVTARLFQEETAATLSFAHSQLCGSVVTLGCSQENPSKASPGCSIPVPVPTFPVRAWPARTQKMLHRAIPIPQNHGIRKLGSLRVGNSSGIMEFTL